MSANSFGHIFKFYSFGESHGAALGAVIEGCPAGVEFNSKLLQENLDNRRPGQSEVVTARNEADEFEVLSGVFEGKTLGTPIAIIVRNKDAQSQDYKDIKNEPRPGHADDVWLSKFKHVDHRGGGRSSGRETLARVIAGSVAQMFVSQLAPQIEVIAYAKKVGPIETGAYTTWCAGDVYRSSVRMPNKGLTQQAEKLLIQAKEKGLSYGGIAEVRVHNPPKNLGQPIFKKIKSELAQAMMSIGATSGFEIGDGFAATSEEGSEYHASTTDQKQYGGVRGGISTGEPIVFRVAFKPTSSVLNTAKQGRHDPCIVPRAVSVVESMTYLVLADQLLWTRLDQV